MSNDPILDELYAVKEALAAQFGFDLHAIAESFRRSATWTPTKHPARPIRTAQARLRMLTDPGDEIRELRRIKEQIAAENDFDIHKIAQAAEREGRKGSLTTPAKSAKATQSRPRTKAAKIRKAAAKIHKPSFRTGSKPANKQNGKH